MLGPRYWFLMLSLCDRQTDSNLQLSHPNHKPKSSLTGRRTRAHAAAHIRVCTPNFLKKVNQRLLILPKPVSESKVRAVKSVSWRYDVKDELLFVKMPLSWSIFTKVWYSSRLSLVDFGILKAPYTCFKHVVQGNENVTWSSVWAAVRINYSLRKTTIILDSSGCCCLHCLLLFLVHKIKSWESLTASLQLNFVKVQEHTDTGRDLVLIHNPLRKAVNMVPGPLP